MGTRIDFSRINTNGINEDRKKIIAIIEKLYAQSESMSLGRIILNLQASILPFDSGSLNNSKIILDRIIHCQDYNSTGNHIGNVKYSELLPLLENKFSSTLEKFDKNTREISFNDELILTSHSDYYIYYYESFNENQKEYKVKFALMGFDSSKNEEWSGGKIYYFEEGIIHKIFELERIEPDKSNPNVLFFTAKYDMQINFFTIKINNKKTRGILPLTYSVLETQYGFPCAGKGILEKISNKAYKKEILDLLNDKIGIKNGFINALYFSKLVLKELVCDKPLEFINRQVELIDDISGLWAGIYLRPDLAQTHKSTNAEKGGVCKYTLYIMKSGECRLYYAVDDYRLHYYSGFIEFPFNDRSLMKISLEFMKEEETYRMFAFLSAGSIGSSELTYAGVISGWTNINMIIYTSAIYMQQILKTEKNISEDLIYEAIKKSAPKRMPKTMQHLFTDDMKGFVDTLTELENTYLAKFSNCITNTKAT